MDFMGSMVGDVWIRQSLSLALCRFDGVLRFVL
jgi:hypothetical protein